MSARITIDVRRRDGEATRLEGDSGIAVCCGPMEEVVSDRETPVVSLRCDNDAQLAWNLAALMATAEHVAPGVVVEAASLMRVFDASRPEAQRRLPKEERE